jgi:hypothetical protein
MIEFTTEQAAALQRLNEQGYLRALRDDLVRRWPGLADDGTLPERLADAFQAARKLGIHSDDGMFEFLDTEAITPGFYERPGVAYWLKKPGADAEQRLRDLMAVARWRYREQQGEKA